MKRWKNGGIKCARSVHLTPSLVLYDRAVVMEEEDRKKHAAIQSLNTIKKDKIAKRKAKKAVERERMVKRRRMEVRSCHSSLP